MDQVADDRSFVAFAPQLVVDAVETFRGRIHPLSAAPFDYHRTAFDEPPEQGRYGSNVHACPRGDLSSGRWPPEVDYREIDSALGLREHLQMSAEVLCVIVDQLHQLLHQLAQRSVPREFGDDNQEARAAAGQNLQRPDLAFGHRVAAHHSPQAVTLLGIQRLQTDDSEQLEERFPCIVQPLEATGGGGEQDDLGFRLQHLAKFPAEIAIHLPADRLQVLHHEDKLFAEPIRRLQDNRAGALLELPAAPLGRQGGVHVLQLPGEFGVARGVLLGEVEQRFKPEVGQTEYLLALFHEADRQQPFGELAVGAQLRGNAG